MSRRCLTWVLAGVALVAPAAIATPAGLECVVHEWAVPPGVWTGSGDVDPTPLLMTATTRWAFELQGCSLSAGTCDVFGSGSRTFQNGVERTEWYATGTQPTISNPAGNTVVYDFSMRDAFVPILMQPRFENMDWTLTAELAAAPSDSPSAAELASASSISVNITHWVDNTLFVISWSGGATETVFTSCTPLLAGLSVDDVIEAEGSGGGEVSFAFNVSRDHNDDAVSVVVQTMDGTAEAGSDYTALDPIVLNFAAGGTLVLPVLMTVSSDDLVELNEGFTLQLSDPVSAIIVDGVGNYTIVDDDAASLSIDSGSQLEGSGGGSVPYLFTVTLDGLVDTTVSVDFDTLDGTAEDETGDGDYIAAQGTLQFAGSPGQTEGVSVDVVADDRPEPDESFSVRLSNVSAGGRDVSIAVADGVASLIDDDVACPTLNAYQQPFDSPSTVAGHPATSGAGATFENVVDGAGAVTTLPPGPVSKVSVWGFGDDSGSECALDPAVPFDLVFAADDAGAPGTVIAQRSNVPASLRDAGSGVSRVDLEFEPFEAGSTSWISVQRAEDAGCAFRWLAEPRVETYDNAVFTPPGPAPDDAYLCVGHNLIFGDGFESGDTGAWTTTVP